MILSDMTFPVAAMAMGLACGVPASYAVKRYLNTLEPGEYDEPGKFLTLAVASVCGICALALALRYGLDMRFGIYFAFTIILTTASFIDLYSFILPDMVTLSCAIAAPLAALFLLGDAPIEVIGGALSGSGIFWLLQFGYRKLRGVEGLGSGDIKLMISLGALCGLSLLPLLILLSCFAALAAALGMRLRGSEMGMQTALPFGPFLCIGAILTLTAGHSILRWYLALVL